MPITREDLLAAGVRRVTLNLFLDEDEPRWSCTVAADLAGKVDRGVSVEGSGATPAEAMNSALGGITGRRLAHRGARSHRSEEGCPVNDATQILAELRDIKTTLRDLTDDRLDKNKRVAKLEDDVKEIRLLLTQQRSEIEAKHSSDLEGVSRHIAISVGGVSTRLNRIEQQNATQTASLGKLERWRSQPWIQTAGAILAAAISAYFASKGH